MASGSSRRVYLHVGAPGTARAVLQNALWAQRDQLAEHGVLYPLTDPGEHFAIAMDVRGMEWGGQRSPEWDGAWSRVAGRITASPLRTAVVSNELLGGATLEQASAMVAKLAPAEVHVVFTATDLGTALASDWQEQVRHTHGITHARFVDDLVRLGRSAPPPFGEMFWGLHDPVAVLPTWAEVVGADHVHVVTVPRGDDPDLLWRRFATVVGADASVPRGGEAPGPLGAAEAELVRRLNERGLPDRLTWMYDGLTRLELAEWILARRDGPHRIEIPPAHRDWLLERSERLIDGVRAGGYDIVGDLGELRPVLDPGAGGLPAELSDGELLDVALDTIGALMLRLGVVQNPPVDDTPEVSEGVGSMGA